MTLSIAKSLCLASHSVYIVFTLPLSSFDRNVWKCLDMTGLGICFKVSDFNDKVRRDNIRLPGYWTMSLLLSEL